MGHLPFKKEIKNEFKLNKIQYKNIKHQQQTNCCFLIYSSNCLTHTAIYSMNGLLHNSLLLLYRKLTLISLFNHVSKLTHLGKAFSFFDAQISFLGVAVSLVLQGQIETVQRLRPASCLEMKISLLEVRLWRENQRSLITFHIDIIYCY